MRCEWVKEDQYQELKGKSILVAGGTGFIGKRAVEIFRSLGMMVYALSRKPHDSTDSIQYALTDLSDLKSLHSVFTGIHFDYAVYMAANIPLRGQKKENYYDAKISTFDPLINFCEAFASRMGRFVYVSSVDVLGGCPEMEYDETADVRIATPYGLAKHTGEFYTKCICHEQGIPYSILRFSQVYGPNEPIVRIIPIIIKAMKEELPFTLVTDGNEKRRFLFVDDAVKAVLHGLFYACDGTYNIAGPDMISMKDLVRLIGDTWGRKIDLTIKGEVAGEDNVPSIDRAAKEIKFVPEVGIQEGIRIVMEEEKC